MTFSYGSAVTEILLLMILSSIKIDQGRRVAQGTPNRKRPLIDVAVPRTRADMVDAMGVDGRRKRVRTGGVVSGGEW